MQHSYNIKTEFVKTWIASLSLAMTTIKWIISITVFSSLISCAYYQNTNHTTKGVVIGGVTGGIVGSLGNGIGVIPGTVTGVVLGGTIGAYLDSHSTLVEKLKNRNVKVFILGDQIMIILFSNNIFNCMTPVIRESACSTLNLVTQLIGNYTNMSVNIAAYTNQSDCPRIDLQLSKAQADSIARYLWRHGVNTRLLSAEGYGGTGFVTRNSPCCPNNANYRIEITLEKLPT